MKTCKKCGESKPFDCFYRNPNLDDGHENACKNCRNVQIATARDRLSAVDPERVKGYQRRWEENNSLVGVVCPTCGREFVAAPVTDPHRKHQTHRTYCSMKCAKLGTAKTGPDNPKWVPKVPVKCKTCHKTFECYPSWVRKDRRQFCSKRCANDWMRTASDYIYGPTWPAQRRKALKRDKETCQHCGAVGDVHVHHKRPYRVSKSNALKNLICLCPHCHTTEEHRLRGEEDRTYEQLRIRTTASVMRRPSHAHG